MSEWKSAPTGTDPEALLRRWRETGDAAALGALFDATAPELFGVALHLCRDPARAEDALQETYLAALESLDRFEEGRRVVPWLVGILRNKLHEVRRFEARAADPARTPRPDAAPDPALEAATAEEQERVRRALAELPEPYREVALLRWRHGLEPAEIAELKRMSPGTVRSLLHRALERLRRAFVALPAVLFGRGGDRAPRGLGAVRDSVLASAPATAAAAGTVVLLGGIVMAKKSVVAAAAAVLLLAGGAGVWTAMRPGDAGDGGPAAAAPLPPPLAKSEPPSATPPPALAAAAAAAETIPPPVDLSKCDRDLDLFGIVVDSKGAPVPGARLTLFAYPLRRGRILVDGYGHWREVQGLSCLSSWDGSFAFRLRRGHLTHVRATKAGFAETVLSDCQAGERLTVVMAAPGRLVLRARDEAGKPVAGVRLRISASYKIYFTRFDREGTTDEAGRCVFESLPPGPTRLHDIEHPRLVVKDRPRMEVPAGGEVGAEIVFQEGRMVRGSVTDADTGKPIVGARVGAYWVLSRPVTTGKDGAFEYPGWLGGEMADLHAVAEGYGRASAPVPGEGSVDFRLHRGDEATGRCLGADGAPVAAAVVCAMGSARETQRQEIDTVTTSTSPDGRFLLTSLRRDLPHTLVVMAPGHGRTLLDFPSREGGPGTIDLGDLRLPQALAIEGRVLSADGEAILDARVTLSGANADRGRLLPKGAKPAQMTYGDNEIRRTDDLGRFRFPDLAPGRYGLTASIEGHTELRGDVNLVAGKDVHDFELRGAAAEASLSLVVEVVDSVGAPIPGIQVSAQQTDGSAERESGPDGTVEIEGLRAGRVSVSASHLGGKATTKYLHASQDATLPRTEPIRLALQPASEVSGTVVGPDGKALGGTMICAREQADTGQPKWYGQVDSEGRFTLQVPPGVPLTVQLPDGRSGAASLPFRGQVEGVIAPAKDVVLRVRSLRSDLTLTVELRDADGAPVAEGHLMLLPGGRRPEHRAFDAAGRIELRDLAEDPFHAMIQAPREPVNPAWTEQVPPAPRDLVPGTEGAIVFRFRRGIPFRGRVVDERGDPVGGTTIALQTQDWATRWVLCAEDGSFSTVRLPGERLRSLAAEKRTADGKVLRVQHADFDPGEGELVLKVVPFKE